MDKQPISYKLPKGWILTTIGKIGIFSSGGTPSRNNPSLFKGNIPWVKSGELNYNIIKDTEEKITQEALENSTAKIVPAGSLLVALYGSTVGKLAILGIDSATNQAVGSIITTKSTNPLFVYYFLMQNRQKLLQKRVGGAQPNISQKILIDFEIPIPPTHEQNQIVEVIEELFSKLDEAKKSLTKITRQIMTLKIIILKNAFSGKLSKNWRNQNSLEKEITFLQNIRDHKELLGNKENELNSKSKKRSKVEEFISIGDKDQLPKLPKGWEWDALGNLCNIIRGASPRPAKDSRYFGGDIPWITVGEITKDEKMYISSVSSFVTELGCQKSRFIEKNNLLLSNSGATLGVPKINLIDGCINDGSLALLNILDKDVQIYLYWFLRSKTSELRMNSQGAGQPNLNTTIVKNINVPIPPKRELKNINEQIEFRFEIADKLDEAVISTCKHISGLKLSILNKAFTGQLVKQDAYENLENEFFLKIGTEIQDLAAKQKIKQELRPRKRKDMNDLKTIEEILQASASPMSAKDVWLQSKHKDDIEAFYTELRDLKNKIIEVKKDTESLLSLRHEN